MDALGGQLAVGRPSRARSWRSRTRGGRAARRRGRPRRWRRRSVGEMPACTWHSPIQMRMFCRPVTRWTCAPRNWSGRKSTSRSAGIDSTTSTALDDGAADVGLGLHLGGGVHVGDDDGAGVLGLPGAQLVGGDRVGQRAAGVRVGDQHGLLGRQDLRRLGHEVDAGEDDRGGVAGRGDPGEGEGVAHVVGDVLDLRRLVVVRQDDGVALGGEPADLGAPGGPLVVATSVGSRCGAERVAVTGGLRGSGGFCTHSRKPTGADPSIPVVTSVWSSPDRPAYPHQALAVVLQVRAARLHVMLWRRADRAVRRRLGAARGAAAGRRDARCVGRAAAGAARSRCGSSPTSSSWRPAATPAAIRAGGRWPPRTWA